MAGPRFLEPLLKSTKHRMSSGNETGNARPGGPRKGDNERNRPAWQLPPGVSRGTWDYVHEASIATQYDGFHHGHPLLELDRNLVMGVADEISSIQGNHAGVAIDLACGTGRCSIPLAEKGWRVIGIDLSQSMLSEVAAKKNSDTAIAHRVALVRGNLVQMSFLADQQIDLAYCLYSSIGMIQGRNNRLELLRHVHRVLRPGGRFIVHVHNRGTWLRDPGGVRRWLADWWRSMRDSQWEFGDRVYAYRGLPSMFLHIFSERELKQDLRRSGFRIDRWMRLNRTSSGLLTPPLASGLRAGGFIAIVQKA